MKLLLLSFLLTFTFSCDHKPAATGNSGGFYRVTKVVDGDTFWVDNGTKKEMKVRLIGIDAPETRRTRKKQTGYYGQEAKEYLSKMILGKTIRLESDVDSLDRYGRTLSYAYFDNTFINANLVKKGYATVLTVPPNVKHVDLLVKMQKQARKKNRGLWKNRFF